MLLIRMVGAYAVHRVNPALMRERASLPIHREQPRIDKLLLLAVLATGFLGLPLLSGLDVFRFSLLPHPGAMIAALGLVLFALGWILKSLALHANAFAVAVLRVQRERGHAVTDSGVYSVVRHPFYAADPLILVGLGLWLESSAAALGAVVPVGLMMVRLHLEERFLRRELVGYRDYAERVRYRLVPGVW
jgi:protein-S-isoprenylcysteine O-methyltransferase Ste14